MLLTIVRNPYNLKNYTDSFLLPKDLSYAVKKNPIETINDLQDYEKISLRNRPDL